MNVIYNFLHSFRTMVQSENADIQIFVQFGPDCRWKLQYPPEFLISPTKTINKLHMQKTTSFYICMYVAVHIEKCNEYHENQILIHKTEVSFYVRKWWHYFLSCTWWHNHTKMSFHCTQVRELCSWYVICTAWKHASLLYKLIRSKGHEIGKISMWNCSTKEDFKWSNLTVVCSDFIIAHAILYNFYLKRFHDSMHFLSEIICSLQLWIKIEGFFFGSMMYSYYHHTSEVNASLSWLHSFHLCFSLDLFW